MVLGGIQCFWRREENHVIVSTVVCVYSSHSLIAPLKLRQQHDDEILAIFTSFTGTTRLEISGIIQVYPDSMFECVVATALLLYGL